MSKVKVTRPINAPTANHLSFEREGLRTSDFVQLRSTKTGITDKRRNLQGQRSRSQGHVMRLTGCWPERREQNVLETQKLVESSQTTGNDVHQFQDQRSRSPGRLMLVQ